MNLKLFLTASILSILLVPSAIAFAAPTPARVCCQNKDKSIYQISDSGKCDATGMNADWTVINDGKPYCPCKDNPNRECTYLVNPLVGDTTDPNVIFGRIISIVLGIMGSLTLLMMVWGGFMWLTSAGNPERIKKGTDTMLWAAIGVFLTLSSYIILINFTNFLTGNQ